MGDVREMARARIKEKCKALEDVSKQLLRPVPFPRTPDEAVVNRGISDVFGEAASILRQITEPDPESVAVEKLSGANLKGTIAELDSALEAQLAQFEDATIEAQRIFSERLDEIKDEYRSRLRRLSEDHAAAEDNLAREYDDFRAEFPEKLYEETKDDVRERDELQSQLATFINQCQDFLFSLPPRMEALRTRCAVLSEEKARLHVPDDEATMVTALEDENENLRMEIEKVEQDLNGKIENLTKELEQCKKPLEERLKDVVGILEQDAAETKEMRLGRIADSKKAALETESYEIESHQRYINDMKLDADKYQKALETADQKLAQDLDKVKKQTNLEIAKKNKEMREMEKAHANMMRHLQQKLQQKLEKETSDVLEKKRNLERQLQQKQKEMAAVLGREISGLTKSQADRKLIVKPVCEPKEPSGRTSPRRPRLTPQSPSEKWRVEIDCELDARLKKFSEAGKMELTSVSRSLESVERKFKAEQLRLKLRMDDMDRQRRMFANEKERLETRLKQAQRAQEILNQNASTDTTKREDELQKKIAQQHAVIAKLKDMLQHEPGHVKISVIAKEHEEEIERLRHELSLLESKNEEIVEEFRGYYQQRISTEKEETENLIRGFNSDYEATMKDIRQTEDLKVELLRNHQMWMAARKEIADSNNRILGVMQSRDGTRVMSSSESSNRSLLKR